MATLYPTAWDLLLQLIIAALGAGLLCFIVRRSLHDQERLREARRRERLRERDELMALFEQLWPEAETGCSTELMEGVEKSQADSPEPLLCSICMQPLVALPGRNYAEMTTEALAVPPIQVPALPVIGPPATAHSGDLCGLLHDSSAERVIRFACPGAHEFHRGCIKGWIQRGRPTCPVCKYDLRCLHTGPPLDSSAALSWTPEPPVHDSRTSWG
uniref:Zinc finger C3HC4 RING-type domain-containing protein n=1 Tax=Pyrodinium bahamense TaxID=73915 RepID=A0A7S0AKJ8_9DINO|mmetsp:Transcript_36654/g.101832  ORF Transcript_36654/g.101832 Transcript_36654/m.101832 type:complete len:215 (+) Transcript_36654:85-729(+)